MSQTIADNQETSYILEYKETEVQILNRQIKNDQYSGNQCNQCEKFICYMCCDASTQFYSKCINTYEIEKDALSQNEYITFCQRCDLERIGVQLSISNQVVCSSLRKDFEGALTELEAKNNRKLLTLKININKMYLEYICRAGRNSTALEII
ncbi:hypothetical protein TTHERM_00615910 (macronuclear) [Tetrahymena thermophila SB210]|uniref:Uncharacterized protein n=1 Tax=Tetrahymena thermophila (strain SB210) TaxID=312017 RepID=I7LXD4_TETTS|nr:hypothetical protein TTHERM_00615910 [Tetrahymena thermophila SB210]EAS04416.1 hypothetical protein TTHERM_00615910 [Tetrahymena thermophila SB210]|eukprot:XP_001024661.1 hypothetical protein TTHERM_00615910 [Tetrahymena thermophila SB210]